MKVIQPLTSSRIKFYAGLLIVLLLSACAPHTNLVKRLSSETNVIAGDRHPQTRVVYPESAFYHNGGRVIDITQPPFNAKGDGITDDTKAIINAYDFIVDTIRERIANKELWPIADNYILYLPDGEYLISDTIEYSGEGLIYREYGKNEGLNNIRFQGESREGTIIRLKDHTRGFEKGKIKPLLSLSKRENNNLQTFNGIENLTINSGYGNPGAVGINHAGANKTSLRNLLICSMDKQGKAGIYIHTSPTQGYHTDITIEGYAYGIWMIPYHVTHNSFEYVTLSQQQKAAVVLDDSTASLRAIKVIESKGPAILQRGAGSQVAIVESIFHAKSFKGIETAIEFQNGSIFARNIYISNYKKITESKDLKTQNGDKIEELIYPKAEVPRDFNPGDSRRSLQLPVEDEPPITYPGSPQGWAVVSDYITAEEAAKANPDYRSALQKALNSGKSFIIFAKKQQYFVSGPVTVPANVKVINGLHTIIKMPTLNDDPLFLVDDYSDLPLTIENLHIDGNSVTHQVPRPLAIRNFATRGSNPYQNITDSNDTKLFLTVVANLGKIEGSIKNQKVWARWINTESPHTPNFPIEATDLWVLGFKTEKFQTSFSISNGSRLEVLGGVVNQFYQEKHADVLEENEGLSPYPIFLVKNSEATIFSCTNGPNTSEMENYEILLDLQYGSNHWVYEKIGAPKRLGRQNQVFIPLQYIGNTKKLNNNLIVSGSL